MTEQTPVEAAPSLFCAGLPLTPTLRAACAKEGITAATPIQAAAIARILAGKQVALKSGTGTGKTLAYALPLLAMAAADPAYRAVIMAPSPELAVQILRCIEDFKEPHVTATGLIGGGSLERQKDRLKKHPQIMVGTPGRLLELIFAKKIKTAKMRALVLDEVDEILSDDIAASLREICSRPECAPQILCASATFGARAMAFMQACMAADKEQVHIDDAPHTEKIRHLMLPYSQQRKDVALLTALHKHNIRRAIVFVNRLSHVGHLFRVFEEAGVPVVSISAERGKAARQDALRALHSTAPCILVATDAAARGIDVKALAWVIHYEMARDVPTYVHRAGRTGRAGKTGTSVAMVAPDQQHLVRMCEKELGVRFDRLND